MYKPGDLELRAILGIAPGRDELTSLPARELARLVQSQGGRFTQCGPQEGPSRAKARKIRTEKEVRIERMIALVKEAHAAIQARADAPDAPVRLADCPMLRSAKALRVRPQGFALARWQRPATCRPTDAVLAVHWC